MKRTQKLKLFTRTAHEDEMELLDIDFFAFTWLPLCCHLSLETTQSELNDDREKCGAFFL